MIIIRRELTSLIMSRLKPGKVVIINGARRTGKTFLLKEILKNIKIPYLLLNGEDINTHAILARRSAENYRQIIGSRKLLAIDEAQGIPEIGTVLKLFIEEIPGIIIIATGSSAFDLVNRTGEPLTGRKYSFSLYPFSEKEYSQTETVVEQPDRLTQRLVYGSYPELINISDLSEKKDYLNELVSSYLLKDILQFENIKYSSKIFNLLRLVAYQVGNPISFNELGTQLAMSKNTVEKYLDLLSKVFILKKVEGFSRNLRKEITKNSKWYFLDNGIRNALIASFNNIGLRNDTGQLWENYMVAERIKQLNNMNIASNNFFWRTYDQQEIDWIEEREGKLSGFEFKWSETGSKAPKTWTKTYPSAGFEVISRENYYGWLTCLS